MTKVLFHSYNYPPIGGSGAQRPLKLSRHLRELGFDLAVVTGEGPTSDRWAPEDATLVSEIPPGVDVRRVPVPADSNARWRGRAERWLWRTSGWARAWIEGSVRAGIEAADDVDLVYVLMQPYASAEAGVRLSQALRRPWIADLGDPWALDEMMVYPSGLHRRRDLARMRSLLESASAIVMSTPEATRRLMAAFPDLGDRPIVAIPNGFAAEDFDEPVTPRADDAFRVVHTGYLHTELGMQHRSLRTLRERLGGSVPGLDILTRSHLHLVEAVNRLIAREPTLGSTLELHLAGVLTDADRAVAGRCPVSRLHGYVTHAVSLDLLRSADLIFLPMHNLPPGVRATIVPGKTYEYLASGVPILAAVPDGDARDLLALAGNAFLVRPDDVEGLVAGLEESFRRARAGLAVPRPAEELVARFEYRRLTEDLVRVFGAVLEPRRGGRD